MSDIEGTIDEMLIPYPDTVKKNRKKHLIVRDEAAACCPQIEANTGQSPASSRNAAAHMRGAKVLSSGR